MYTKTLFSSIICIFLLLVDRSDAQTGLCSSSLVQATVSNLNNQIASYMPTLTYDPANNRFVASIFNNVQVLSQSQCSNLIGNSAPTPGITSFSIYLSCTGPENNGNGIIGGIQLPVTNVSTTAILNTVNIPVGSTYSNIPIKPHNPQASLSNRRCVVQLQATLYAILGGGYCQACYNVPIVSINYDTGASGDSQPCEFFDLTCYNNFGILWRSTWLWCVVIMGTLLLGLLCYFAVKGNVVIKREDMIHWKEITALKADDQYLKRLMTAENKRLADYNSLLQTPVFTSPSGTLPLSSSLSREIMDTPTLKLPSAPSAGKKQRRQKAIPALPPPQLITVTDDDESSSSTEEDDQQSLLPQQQPSPPKQRRKSATSTSTGPSVVPITQPSKTMRSRFLKANPKAPTREEIEKPAF